MLPGFEIQNISYGFPFHAKKFRRFFVWPIGVKHTYLRHVHCCKDMRVPSFPPGSVSLYNGIKAILRSCSKPKMLRVYAQLIVSVWTIVTNFKGLIKRSVYDEPRNSVNRNGRPSTWPNKSISCFCFPFSLPNPAAVCLFYSVPKRLDESLREWMERGIINLHSKTFLLSVMGAIGYSRWLSLPKVSQCA